MSEKTQHEIARDLCTEDVTRLALAVAAVEQAKDAFVELGGGVALLAWAGDRVPFIATPNRAQLALVAGAWISSPIPRPVPTPMPSTLPSVRLPNDWTPDNFALVEPTMAQADKVLTILSGDWLFSRTEALNLVAWLATVARLSPAEIALARRSVAEEA